MKALIDADILRFETAFGAVTGWKAMHPEDDMPPSWDYVEQMLHYKINNIVALSGANSYELFMSEGKNFRHDIAKKKIYKGNRKEERPWHYDNMTAYLKYVLGATVANGIEADDLMAIIQTTNYDQTIICTRDKDLRAVEGWHYGWENGKQPSFGPVWVDKVGDIELAPKNEKIKGTGEAFFWSQVLTGDPTDNTPGLPACGPVAAYGLLKPITARYRGSGISEGECLSEMEAAVCDAYRGVYGHSWREEMQEQVDLHWLLRGLNEDGTPMLRKVNV